jgi:glycosyltransferase involved in cell wall biosynthesis
MRILYHHRIRSKDGQFVHVEELIHALRAQGHEVHIAGPRAVEKDAFGGESRTLVGMRNALPRWMYELLEFGYSLIAFARLFVAALRSRPHFIYERYNMLCPAGVWVSRLLGLPLVLEVNAPLYEERAKFGGLSLHWLARWSERVVWRNADCVLPVTEVLAGYVRAAGADPMRITVVPNGIDFAKFRNAVPRESARAALGLESFLVLGFTGFVREWHGLESVLDVLKSDPRLYLLVVGDGPARASIEARAKALGVETRVRITGVVERGEINRYVSAFDVALQPDVVEYASPLKLFEYLALARPVVAPDRPNIREILEHERNALLFRPRDFADMARAITHLCADADLRARLGEAGRQTILDRDLTWEGNARKVAAIGARLAGGQGADARDPV